ncbi:MAG: Nif3-like dinuclear metal center hexameric protein [Bryobacteraceae bacterium]|jgi:putative NIF3 family GTP cyclohydrolase 1 type 2
MHSNKITRRELAALAGVAVAGAEATAARSGTLTAREAIERIQKNVGVPWRKQTVDTFKAGDPDTPVLGIATSFMATLDVLQRAAAAGKNLIVSHEPTFYNHLDETKDLADDPIYKFKMEFIKQHKLVIWRFHDHWHARQPDAIMTGLAQLLGWDKHQAGSDQRYYVLPATTLGELARTIQERLKVRTLRAIGDPQSRVSRVSLSPGAAGLMAAVRTLPQADVYVCGEATEWEGIEYARDTIAAGQKKGMILVGHVVTEDPGMNLCAQWLKTFIPEVPIEWIPTGEPFWRPA